MSMIGVSPGPEGAPPRKTGETRAQASQAGMSPYATGGGGVTFERKVEVRYLSLLLSGDGSPELGEGRSVVSVAFQQAPKHPVDDLVVSAALPDESEPSLVLSLGIRRSPNIVPSDESMQRLIRSFVRAVIDMSAEDSKHRLGLVVAAPQQHAKQLGLLADHAAVQMDASGFFDLIRTPNSFDSGVRGRLQQLEGLVGRAVAELEGGEADTALVQYRTWQLLSRLSVLMPRLESPDETDWMTVANSLVPVARGSDLPGAFGLRDRLVALADEYSPKAARVDLTLLRRHAHAMLDSTVRRHRQGWQALDHLHERAQASVSDEITAGDGARRLRLDRSDAAAALLERIADASAVIATGESGVGKSALALLSVAGVEMADADASQVLCVNLRHIPKLTVEFENVLGCPLAELLRELSAPRRVLIVDAADAVAEGMQDALANLVDAAHESDVKVIAVTSTDSEQVVRDILSERVGADIPGHVVPPLGDPEINEIVDAFPELGSLSADPRSRALLRRLVVIDLFVRGRVSGVPLTDADAMNEVWMGLVRQREPTDRGSPDARELALLRLAELELSGGERLDAISDIDPTALDGLRRDGLLRTSPHDPFMIGPEFAHDELRRYAVARRLLDGDTPASRVLSVGAPRWSLSAAVLACQAWLARPDTIATPLRGRFATLEASFDRLVDAGFGARWGDVPGEALLVLADPDTVLRDSWTALRADNNAGLRRLARLVDQRHRDDTGIVNRIAVEPIITLLLDDDAPWRSGEYAADLLRDWLQAHVFAGTHSGHPLRVLLRDRLVRACEQANRDLAEQQEAEAARRAARTPEEVERDRQIEERNRAVYAAAGYGNRRQRPEVPYEITNETVVELLALLGPDLGSGGEAILRRVAEGAPSSLAPAVERPLTGHALADYGGGLLAHLTEAYYVDDKALGTLGFDDGIRHHEVRTLMGPSFAWHLGPFIPLFQADFRDGVAVLNRLLNHASQFRARTLARLDQDELAVTAGDGLDTCVTDLEITGSRRRYVGDDHVWCWYRGTTVGPYPCFSALQALERECDRLIERGAPLRLLIPILLEGCENLAMVGLVVGLLVRHLENAENLLDPYVAEPHVWKLEFSRLVHEMSGPAASSEGLVRPERRNWSLQEAALFMAVHADEARAAELCTLKEKLIANARRDLKSAGGEDSIQAGDAPDGSVEQELISVRNWANNLDPEGYNALDAPNGVRITPTPPADVAAALELRQAEFRRAIEANRLFVRYYGVLKTQRADEIGPHELATDLATARQLLENPPTVSPVDLLDVAGLVAAAALNAHLVQCVDLPAEGLAFAADTVLRIGEGEAGPRDYEMEATYFERGADRSAARALPLLLLPAAASLRATIVDAGERSRPDRLTAVPFLRRFFLRRNGRGPATPDRLTAVCTNLAQAVANEVRLHLARALDHLWHTPCTEEGGCHHEVGLRLATETMRDCVLGDYDPKSGRRRVLMLAEPDAESLAEIDDQSVRGHRLDGAIRALAPAAAASICVSTRARALLSALLATQRRSLLSYEHDRIDDRGTHTLVSARALLTLAEHDDAAALHDHLGAYVDNPALLANLLRALSAAAEETPTRAETARRIWPNIIRRVLELNDANHGPFEGHHYGDMALASLLPNPAPDFAYLYREIQDEPIRWWEPLGWRSEIEAWLVLAAGNATCVDQLIIFLHVLTQEEQARAGLPWVATLVLANPGGIANRSHMCATWLIETRATATEAGLEAQWQQVVDALAVAGRAQLAPYSV